MLQALGYQRLNGIFVCEKGESQELSCSLFLELMRPLLSLNPALPGGKKLSRLSCREMDLSEVAEIIRVEP